VDGSKNNGKNSGKVCGSQRKNQEKVEDLSYNDNIKQVSGYFAIFVE